MQEVEAKLGGTQEFTGMPSRNQLETVHFQIENTCRENCKWWVFQPALLAGKEEMDLVSCIFDSRSCIQSDPSGWGICSDRTN